MAYVFGSNSMGYGQAAVTGTTITAVDTIATLLHDTILVWCSVVGVHTFTCADNFLNTYTLVNSVIAESSSTSSMALFICRDCNTAGTCSPVITIDSTAIDRNMQIMAITGLSNSAALSSAVSNPVMTAGTDAVVSGNVTPAAQPAIVLGFLWDGYNIAPAAGTGFTLAPQQEAGLNPGGYAGGYQAITEHKRVTSTAATNATFTMASGSPNGCAVLALAIPEPIVAGGGGPPQNKLATGLGIFL